MQPSTMTGRVFLLMLVAFFASVSLSSALRSSSIVSTRSFRSITTRGGAIRPMQMSTMTKDPSVGEMYTMMQELVARVDRLEKENLMLKASAGGSTLTELCQISKQACDILQPMIQAFYDKINGQGGEMTKKKADATYFTIVDGIVQHLIITYLLKGNKFADIVGEEDGSDINIMQKPFHVDELIVPDEFTDMIARARDQMTQLSKKIDYFSYKGLTVFVDPIDGTREFATGKGEACSMLIGYNDQFGNPVAGIMYRPVLTSKHKKVTWAAGAKSESYFDGELDKPAVPNHKGMLVTDAKVSDFIVQLTFELGYVRVPSLASGNRALMLLEGKAGAYIRDTGGFAKWDCSGPGAVLEAYGGVMGKLPGFMESKRIEPYTYLKSEKNLDFEPGVISLTLSNAKDKSAALNMRNDGEHDLYVDDVDTVKEYSCLLGLVALTKDTVVDVDIIHDAMLKVKDKNGVAPTYN